MLYCLEAVQAGRKADTEPAAQEAETSSEEDGDPAHGGHRHRLNHSPAGGADEVLWQVGEVGQGVCFVLQPGKRIE